MALEHLENTFTKYPCRDKLLRVCQYAAIFYDGALVEPRNDWLSMARRFIYKDIKSESTATRVSSSISAARLVFRLLNTPATLSNVKNICQKWNEVLHCYNKNLSCLLIIIMYTSICTCM